MQQQPATTATVTVQRAFSVAGQRVEPGSTVTLPRALAARLCGCGKAVAVRQGGSDEPATLAPRRRRASAEA